MSLSKPFMTITSLAVAAIFGGGVYMMMNMDTLAKQMTQRMATEALGVKVTMGNLEISLPERKAVVSSLRIGNPEGFSKPHAVTIDRINIDLEDISKELITFDDISISGTRVNLEVTEAGTNLHAIQKNLTPAAPANEPSVEDEYVQKIKVIIDHLEVEDAQLNPAVTLLTAQELSPVTVPDIELTGIGRKENGVLAQEAIVQVWSALSKNFSQAANGAGFYEGLATDILDEIGAGQIEGIKSKISEGINEVGKSLKGFFGN